MIGEIAQVRSLALRQAGCAQGSVVEGKHAGRIETGKGRAPRMGSGARHEAPPDGVGSFHRDLLSDDGAGERGEGIASALEMHVRMTADDASEDLVAARELAGRLVPVDGPHALGSPGVRAVVRPRACRSARMDGAGLDRRVGAAWRMGGKAD
jgi:hypothetical protein